MTQPHNLADMNRFKRARLDSLASSLAMGAVFLGCLGARAVALQSPSSPIPDAQLQEVVVTGSRISRTDVETASPITVLSRDDLEKSGQQNLAEIIRNISAEGQGSLPTAFTAGFASGASAISLRGLGVNSTLVLVNGRRMAPYGLADDGSTGRVAGSYGFGDLAADKYNVYFTAQVSTQDAIKNTDRPGYLGTENLFVRTNLRFCPALSPLDGLNAAGQPVKSNICCMTVPSGTRFSQNFGVQTCFLAGASRSTTISLATWNWATSKQKLITLALQQVLTTPACMTRRARRCSARPT